VPFLNDYLVSLFDFNLYNIKFSELLNYLDIFEKYNEHLNNKRISTDDKISKHSYRLLSKYFKLPYIYLSFSDYNLANSAEIGSSSDNVFYLNSNTGKSKIMTNEFLKYLKFFNPEFCEVPYELVKILFNPFLIFSSYLMIAVKKE